MKITIKNQIDSRKDPIVGIHPTSQKLQDPDNISPMKISGKMLQYLPSKICLSTTHHCGSKSTSHSIIHKC